MAELDLEDVRIKEPSELDDNEKKFLNENWAELDEDEKETFKDLEEKKEESFAFKTKDEFDEAVSSAVTKAMEAAKKVVETKEEEEKETKEKGEFEFVDPTWKAPNWNEAAKRLFPIFKDKIVKEIQDLNVKQRERLAEINEEFDKEIEELAKIDKTIPAKGTAERDEFDAELAKIGAQNRDITSMTAAYGVWKARGGKVETKDLETKEEEGTPVEGTIPTSQKDLARKISKGGAEKKVEKEQSYARIAGRTLRDLVAEEIEKIES